MPLQQILDGCFSLDVPADWEIWNPVGDDLFVAAASELDEDGFQPQIIVSKEKVDKGTTAMGYLVGNLVYMRSQLNGFREHESWQCEIDGTEAAGIFYSLESHEKSCTIMMVFIVRDGNAYLISCCADSEQFDHVKNEFENIVASIRFT
jgi:hypothetical protein